MNTQLKASLLLSLEDKLSAGLKRFQDQIESLARSAGALGLTELEESLDRLRGGAGSIDGLTDSLRGTERQADRTAAAIKRMAQSANDNVIRVNGAGQAFGMGSRGALTIMPAAGGGGGAANDFAGGASAPLLLAGPGGSGGIPLNLGRTFGAAAAARGIYGAGGKLGEAAGHGVGGMLNAGAEAFAVYEPIKLYAEYENTLRHIAITERKTGAAVGVEIKRLTALFAKDALETGQSSKSIADAYSDLVQTGIPASVLDVAIKAHSKAATAYNVSPEAMGPAVGALLQNLKIPEGELGNALAAMAQASKEGRFKIEDFSRQLPGISGELSLLGMTGRKAADIGFAGLETVMKNSGEPNQAAAGLYDALRYITAPIANRSFAKAGIDLPKLLRNAEKHGINPLDAVLGKLDQRTRGLGPVDKAEYLGKLLHNQEAGKAIQSLLDHKKDFLELRKLLDGVNSATLNTDFITAFAAPAVQMRILNEQMTQLVRILGEGFGPTLSVVNVGLHYLLVGLTWMNKHMPETLHWVLGITSGMLMLGSAITVLGVIAPVFNAGWGLIVAVLKGFGVALELLFTPVGLVIGLVAALGAAAYDIYENWARVRPFFVDLWEGIKGIFVGFITFVSGFFRHDLKEELDGLITIGQSIGKVFEAIWEIAKVPFNDFLLWVDRWTGGLGPRIYNGIRASLSPFQGKLLDFLVASPSDQFHALLHAGQLRAPDAGTGGPGAAAGVSNTVNGVITVQAAPGTAATATSGNPRVPLVATSAPNAGPTLRRH